MSTPAHPSLDSDLLDRLNDLDTARGIAAGCIRCDLARGRTQVVFGQGALHAALMLVGEGPGEEEDIQGAPFVGAAGRLLNGVLEEIGLAREQVWITNTVRCRPTLRAGNSLKNRPPRVAEIRACKIWMEVELRLVAPQFVVCLGAVAAKALIRKDFRLSEERGKWFPGPNGTEALATIHPSYVLRQRGGSTRQETRGLLLADLALAAQRLAAS